MRGRKRQRKKNAKAAMGRRGLAFTDCVYEIVKQQMRDMTKAMLSALRDEKAGGRMSESPKMKFFHLRYASIIGCAEHGPFWRDIRDDCYTCQLVLMARSWRCSGKFGVMPQEFSAIYMNEPVAPRCRRCGLRRDDDHVKAPYLCRFEPRRELVGDALMGEEMAIEILERDARRRAAT